MNDEKLARFIIFIKINIFDLISKISRLKNQLSEFTFTKYKLQEFIVTRNKVYALYNVRPTRHTVKTELRIIFKDKNFLKSFNKEDMVKMFYTYVKNYRDNER